MTQLFGYVRVSNAKKQGENTSLGEQRDSIAAYSSRHDITIIEYLEEKETAAKRGRPVFTDMLSRIRKGEARGVVIHKIDRSARNLRDWADLGELMDEGYDVHFSHESLDLNTRGGRLSADLQAVIAADFIRNLSEETKKGHTGRLKQGLYPFTAPIGYTDEGPGKPKGIDPVRGPLIEQAFQLYATGEYSIATLAEHLYDLGLRTKGHKRVFKSQVGTILRNPFYMGLIDLSTHDTVYQGKQEPLVSRRLFEKVQTILDGKMIVGKTTHHYRYRKLFNCGLCGRFLVPSRHKGHVYYRCQKRGCPTKTAREELLDEHVEKLLQKVTLGCPHQDFAREYLEQKTATHQEEAGKHETRLKRELGRIEARLERLTNGYLDGDIESELYRDTRKKLTTKQAQFQQQIDEPNDTVQEICRTIEDALELASGAQQTYANVDDAEKRRMLRIVSSNRSLSQRELAVEPAMPFSILVDASLVRNGSTNQSETRKQELTSIMDALWEFASRQNCVATNT